ncbi:MAG: 3-methyl-2-oxobutanoate hydroxymethyltransferase [Chloroflexi bacterium]|nr:3-methyl-2-oxobutanoate hydroxymethyltransferase [Chloroflexota bacterium]
MTIPRLWAKKSKSIPITMVTAYDYSSALLVDQANMDMILVGDSLAMVMMGLDSTNPVTMEVMLHHGRMAARGAKSAFLVGDMPFMSYQVSTAEAVRNAGRFLQEASMEAVKLEGGREVVDRIQAIVAAGIPVMGHIGLTPQSVTSLGGYKVQGKTAVSAHKLWQDAQALQEIGCFSMVLEAVPAKIAAEISQRLQIPTIGIGAGAGCDGQVLVYHDMLGLFDKFQPKFAKRYANIGEQIRQGLITYRKEVEAGSFPAKEHSFAIPEAEFDEFLTLVDCDESV